MGLWGTSLGGGHALVVAAADNSINAVVSQIPAILSGAESIVGTLLQSPGVTSLGLVKFLGAICKWAVMAALYGTTTYVPLHGLPGSTAIMQNPGDDEGYPSLTPPKGGEYGWRNAATVGSGLSVLIYRPINTVSDISVPSLLIAAADDTLCPAANIKKAASMIDGAELMLLPNVGHFDVYTGELLQTILAATVSFFQKHLVISSNDGQ
jgi:pimeloyl-ACP methyl ester carboxylesterase